MDEEHEDCGEDQHPYADRGVYNAVWVLKAAIQTSNPISRWNALAGFAKEMEAACPCEDFNRDEVIDILVQCLYTGEYVNPFEHAWKEESEDAITEEEIETFTSKLDFFGEDRYTDDEDDD